jgi:hypothetical protein
MLIPTTAAAAASEAWMCTITTESLKLLDTCSFFFHTFKPCKATRPEAFHDWREREIAKASYIKNVLPMSFNEWQHTSIDSCCTIYKSSTRWSCLKNLDKPKNHTQKNSSARRNEAKKTMPLVSSQNPSCCEHKKDKHTETERAGWRIFYSRGPEAYDDGRAQHGAHRVLLPLLHRTIEEELHFPTEKERRSYSHKWILLYRTQLRKCC